MASEETRRRLIEATVAVIERDGFAHVTTRAIAAEAGTNIASVNYHFRSKDELVAGVLRDTLRSTVADCVEILAPGDADAPVRLFTYLLQGARAYPRLTQAHAALEDPEAQAGWGALRDALAAHLGARGPELSGEEATRRATTALAAVLFLCVHPGFFGANPLAAPEELERYAAFARAALLGAWPAG